MQTPKWMIILAERVAISEGFEIDRLPEIKVRNARKLALIETQGQEHGSSGSYNRFFNKIKITLGTHRRGQKMVLLHELTHWLMPYGEKHSARFFEKAFELYRRYHIPVSYAKRREFNYKKKAAHEGYKQNLDKFRKS